MRSISSGCKPAISIARCAASVARSLAITPGSAKCREDIPLRETIHSSDVSSPRSANIFARSELLTFRGGKLLPVPTIFVYIVMLFFAQHRRDQLPGASDLPSKFLYATTHHDVPLQMSDELPIQSHRLFRHHDS